MARAPDDPETRRRQVALFRHAIIGELDIEALPRGERSARLAELAARTYQTPDGRERRFSVRTLWTWWSAYQRTGLEGLLPKVRKDHGQPKAVDRALLEAAITLRREVPSRSTATLIHILQTAGRIVPGQLRRDAGPPPRRGRDGPPATADPRRQALHPAALPAPQPALGWRLSRGAPPLGSRPPALPDAPSRRDDRPLLQARPARAVVPERAAGHPRRHPETGRPQTGSARGPLRRLGRGLPRRPVRLRLRPPRHPAPPQQALRERRPRRHRTLESHRRRAGRARDPGPAPGRPPGNPAPVRGLA